MSADEGVPGDEPAHGGAKLPNQAADGGAKLPGDKAALRRAALAARRRLGPADRRRADAAIAGALLPRARAAAVIAAYIPMPDEPGAVDLLDAMSAFSTVVAPVPLPSGDLDWAAWTGADDLAPAGGAGRGGGSAGSAGGGRDGGARLMRPTGPTLGADYLRAAELIVVPALSADRAGRRLGRGGGSYDRALRRARPSTPIVALLFDGELVTALPADEWDIPVHAAITPGLGWTDLPAI
ncbi:MAG: hypothetical protein LBQ06_00715 [Frankiaceae bacterium]|jgi:5-formyltetrahydrofolate cyclo-ligase|nr:hypothetical protein [Frankiaceae bacterium]